MTPKRAFSVYTTISALSAEAGPAVPHYAAVLENGRLYTWVPDDETTADAYCYLAATGGYPGRWRIVGGDVKGADLTDADATLTVAGKLLRYLPAATLSANRTLTLSTAGAVAGLVLTIVRLDVGAFTVAVVNGGAGAGTLVTLPVSKTATFQAYFDGSNWRYHSAAVMP